ncbi:MAG: hypothetical protein L3J20_09955 [Flavobacteriaceae bacterium]|nr:hypothetical protein [Flavobacteriaceae bacterium]
MEKKALYVLLIFSIVFFTNCNDDSKTFIERELEIITIGKGTLSGSGLENIINEQLIVSDKILWDNLLIKIDAINDITSTFSETDVNFESYIILAAFEGIKDGGWTIDITKVLEQENNILVQLENLNTGDGTLIQEQPFHIIKVKKTNKSLVEFQLPTKN